MELGSKNDRPVVSQDSHCWKTKFTTKWPSWKQHRDTKQPLCSISYILKSPLKNPNSVQFAVGTLSSHITSALTSTIWQKMPPKTEVSTYLWLEKKTQTSSLAAALFYFYFFRGIWEFGWGPTNWVVSRFASLHRELLADAMAVCCRRREGSGPMRLGRFFMGGWWDNQKKG